MKNLIILSIVFLTAIKAYPQEESIIKFGSEVTLTLTANGKDTYSYKIAAVKKFNKKINLDDNDLLNTTLDTNQVKLYFCQGGYDIKDQTLLIIKSGLKTSLKYSAKIRISENGKFESTSMGPLIPGVISTESWHFPLEAIILGDFSKETP
jgi:hypothetical protein